MEKLLFRVVPSYLCEYMESVQISKNMNPEAFIDKNMGLIRHIREKMLIEYNSFPMKEDLLQAADLFHATYFNPKFQPD